MSTNYSSATDEAVQIAEVPRSASPATGVNSRAALSVPGIGAEKAVELAMKDAAPIVQPDPSSLLKKSQEVKANWVPVAYSEEWGRIRAKFDALLKKDGG